jgi:hypothetical protein
VLGRLPRRQAALLSGKASTAMVAFVPGGTRPVGSLQRYGTATVLGLLMCFSAEASFTVGGLLVPAGVYCVRAANYKNPRWLALAVVPIIFGIQQFSEGFVWLGLRWNGAQLTSEAALVFLFPALAGWPFWMPFMAWSMETQPVRQRLLLILTLLSTAWFWLLFFPLLRPDPGPTVAIQRH